jgi:plasmid maintenance system killer protein
MEALLRYSKEPVSPAKVWSVGISLPCFHDKKLRGICNQLLTQHSIRINDQWRVCFVWTDNGPMNVEIVDYH